MEYKNLAIDNILLNKLVIGTAQLSGKYSINQKQEMSNKEVAELFDVFFKIGFNKIDTAQNYGNAETIIGALNKESIQLTTKIEIKKYLNYKINLKSNIECLINSSKKKITSDYYNFLIHDWDLSISKNYKDIIDYLKELRDRGVINKIGVSIYDMKELTDVLEKFSDLDIIQLPYHVFNQGVFDDKLLEELSNIGVIIQARSVFLQGLLINKETNNLDHIPKIRNHLDKWLSFNNKFNYSTINSALSYVLNKRFINEIIVGFDNLKQFRDILKFKNIHNIDYTSFTNIDKNTIDPRTWKK